MNENFSIFETKLGDNAIISFDLFDTLIEAPYNDHGDIFELMRTDVDKIIGKKNFDFKKIRILAEKNAVKNKQPSEILHINDIYKEFQRLTQLGNAYVMEIEKLELVNIQKNYQIKPIGKQIYDIAQALNKKIVIVADTYYPRFVLESILEKTEYFGYHEIFITSELEMSAQNGNIFAYMSDKLQCSPKYIMHIGDDELVDSINPKKIGFNTLPILSSKESYKNSLYYKEIWKNGEENQLLSTRLINGMLSMKFFQMSNDKPINFEGSVFNNQFSRIGYFGLGPLLLGYTQWILQKSQEDYVKHIYFLSSNGKFLKQSYEILSKHYNQAPIAYDLLTSQNVEKFTKLYKNHELYEILDEDYINTPIKDYFISKFNLDIEPYGNLLERYGLNINSNITKSINEKQVEAIFEYLKIEIIEKSKQDNDYYSAYLKYQHLPNPDKSAIVDIGNQENMQVVLSDIIKQKIGGYYMFTFFDMIEDIKKQEMSVSGYVSNFDEKKKINEQLNLLFGTSESIFSHFSLSENIINPIFEDEEFTASTKEAIEEMQQQALEFVSDFEKLYSKNISQLYFSSKQVFRPIDYFLNKDKEGKTLLNSLNLVKTNLKNIETEINILVDGSKDESREGKQSESILIKIGKLFHDIKKTL